MSRQRAGGRRRDVLWVAGSFLLAGGCSGNGSGPDTTPPHVPRGVIGSVAGTTTKIFWTANTESDLSHYLLYMGTRTDSMYSHGGEITLTSKFIHNLTAGTTYYFAVSSVDESGNESEQSTPLPLVPTSATWSTSLGWSSFTAGEYSAALGHFQTARSLLETHAEAFLGLGWSYLMLDNLSNARVEFQQAIVLGLQTKDADAGLAVINREIPNLPLAISHALTVLNNDPLWVFTHQSSIDYRDMRLLLAQCYFRQGEAWFDEAQTQVDILDPTNGLDPGDQGTWLVGGTAYTTYVSALMTLIMDLETAIGG
ncbi:hypothetical protein ACFL3H_03295 [Gemmatimonadota bacterium]